MPFPFSYKEEAMQMVPSQLTNYSFLYVYPLCLYYITIHGFDWFLIVAIICYFKIIGTIIWSVLSKLYYCVIYITNSNKLDLKSVINSVKMVNCCLNNLKNVEKMSWLLYNMCTHVVLIHIVSVFCWSKVCTHVVY